MYYYFLPLVAILPSIIILILVYQKDRIEKESAFLLFKLFVLGIAATFLTIILSSIFEHIIPMLSFNYEDLNIYQKAFKCLIGIALLEEFSKWILNYFITWKNKEFNYIYDAIIYCVFISIGFATFENIIYVNDYGLSTAIFRAIVSVPGHAFFGVYMGYYLGYAKLNYIKRNKQATLKYKLLSLLIPIILHFIYDFCLVSNLLILYLIFFIYIILLYKNSLNKISKVSKKDFNLNSN